MLGHARRRDVSDPCNVAVGIERSLGNVEIQFVFNVNIFEAHTIESGKVRICVGLSWSVNRRRAPPRSVRHSCSQQAFTGPTHPSTSSPPTPAPP